MTHQVKAILVKAILAIVIIMIVQVLVIIHAHSAGWPEHWIEFILLFGAGPDIVIIFWVAQKVSAGKKQPSPDLN